MRTEKYAFAGLVFAFHLPLPLLENEMTRAFLVPDDRETDFVVEICQEEGEIDPLHPVRTLRDGNILRVYMDVSLLPGVTAFGLLCGIDAAWILPERGRFMLHASYIVHCGEAILFAAPSETGKSTQARFWRDERGAEIVNEDRVILSREDGVFYAHGAWAMGTAGVTENVSAPLRAVVLLGQGEENRVYEPSVGEKLRRLVPQCTFKAGDMAEQIRIIDRVTELIEGARIVAFDCLNDPGAVDVLEESI